MDPRDASASKKKKKEREEKLKEEQKLDQVQALVAIYGSGNLTAPQGGTLALAGQALALALALALAGQASD